jgi:hypothetical protein
MALPELHIFTEDLKHRPAPGSNAPPRTVRAKDLDDNFKKVTLLESNEDPPAYNIEYTKHGVLLTGISGLPEGATAKEFNVCENGNPESYWLLTWEDEPEL